MSERVREVRTYKRTDFYNFIPLPYSLRTLCPGLEIPEGRPQAWVVSLAISIPGIARQGGGDHAQHRHGGAVARMEEDA